MTGAPSSPEPPAVRDRGHVEREYGREKWPAVARIAREGAAGEARDGSALARTHRHVVREYAMGDDPLAQREVLLAGARRSLPAAVAVGGVERYVAEAVVGACTPQTDLVLELGSGWGWHVLGAWLSGAPREALYVGAEITAAGRDVAAGLAELDPALRFRALEFDYLDPSLDALGTFREAVVFTVHSIEQIPRLPAAALRAVAGVASTVRCLHFEPVGWQAAGGGDGGTAQAHAERHDYNRDLLAVLRAEEEAGTLAVEEMRVDVTGLNPDNPTTLVRWSARGQ